MKKSLLILSVAGLMAFQTAQAQTVIFDNGPVYDVLGGGAGGGNASTLHDGMSTYGAGHAVSTGFRMADDIVIPCGQEWVIDSLVFYAYQTGSGTTSSITGVNVRIWNGIPGAGGSIIWGDSLTDVMITTEFDGGYRTGDFTSTTCAPATCVDRPIMRNATVIGQTLPSGTYWIDWQTDGSLASGPWAPPVNLGAGNTTTGNGLQYSPTTATWGAFGDGGTLTPQGLPMLVVGTVNTNAALPVANFSASSTTVNAGATVNFTDASTGTPTSWNWSFPGGTPNTSNVQNPSITYSTAGTYTVTLSVTNAAGSCTETKTSYITVNPVSTGGCDTLTNLPATFTPTILLSNNSGYVIGHNGYGDLAKADKYSQPLVPNSQIVGMLIGFGIATNGNTTNTFNMKVWDAAGTGGSPGASVVSATKTYADAAADVTNGDLTFVSFTPTNVTSPFFAGIEFTYAAGDTLAIIHTADGEVNPGTAWEQFDTGVWYAVNSSSSWGLNIGLAVFPIICESTGINSPVQDGIVIYPNPTSGQLIIHNSNNTSNPATITITNMVGQTVITRNVASFNGTQYVDLSALENGVYFVEVNTGNTKMVNRVVLNK